MTEGSSPIESAKVLRPAGGDGVSPDLARLREHEPVAPVRMADGEQVWLVSRHDAVRAALLDPRLVTHGEHAERPTGPGATLAGGLLNQEPGPHARMRRLAAPGLTRARLRRHRPFMAARARALLREAAAEPVTDLVASIARPFSFACLVEVFGVAAEHRAALGPALTVLFDRPDHRAAAVIEAAVTVEDTIRSELARRSAGGGHRGDDVLSMIARGAAPEAEGCRDEADVDHEDVVSLAGTLLMGAFDSTAQMIGLAAATLLSRPALWARAIADPAGLSDVVEELLRWDSPGPFSTPRRATEELCIGGVAIPRGSRVILALGAANRDPLRHADPEQLDPDRHSSDRGEPRCPVTGPGARRAPRHLAFGSGMHACPGAALARLELAVALRELLTGYPQSRLTVPVAQLRRLGSLHRRLAELPVALAG